VTGVLLILLGIAAALAPLLGPEIGLTIGSDKTFDVTEERLYLSVIPGAVVAVGGLLLLVAANRPVAMVGALMALAGGIWLIVGPLVSRLWEDSGGLLGAAGRPDGTRTRQTIEILAYFNGTGALITALAGIALGRLAIKAASDHGGDHDHDRGRDRVVPPPAPTPRRRKPVVEEPAPREPVAVEEPPRREPVVDEPPRDASVVDDPPSRREPIIDEEPPRREPVVEEQPTRVVEEPVREPVAEAPRTEARPSQEAQASSPRGRSGGLMGRIRDRLS